MNFGCFSVQYNLQPTVSPNLTSDERSCVLGIGYAILASRRFRWKKKTGRLKQDDAKPFQLDQDLKLSPQQDPVGPRH